MLKQVTLVANIKTSLSQVVGDVVGVDRGALYLASSGIRMTFAVGDFDSVSIEERNLIYQMSDDVIQLEAMKDFSDSQAAIDECKKRGYEKLLFLGSIGGRLDHHYVNQQMCIQENGIELVLMDDRNKIFCLDVGTHSISKNNYKYLSLFAIEDAIVTFENVKYVLTDYFMDTKNLIGLSNEILGETCIIHVQNGRLLAMQTND
ncbi:thiamine diphosphokinase [Anaerorhabdus sp.]|jgi:thiamine pyrophosphokinase|uniref:thiamine diphosphokinase n=1 Tax=Anaerorhabdus sp. TaxID=1872524 RepID=UPI002FC6357B